MANAFADLMVDPTDPEQEIPLAYAERQSPAETSLAPDHVSDDNAFADLRSPEERESTEFGEKAQDFGEGMLYQTAQDVGGGLGYVAKAAPWLLPFLPKNAATREFIEDSVTKAGEAVKGLHTLGPEGPQTPEELFGADMAPVGQAVLGGPAALASKGAVSTAGRMAENFAAKRAMTGVDKGEEAASRLHDIASQGPRRGPNVKAEVEDMRKEAGERINKSYEMEGVDQMAIPPARTATFGQTGQPVNELRDKMAKFMQNDSRAKAFMDKDGNPKGILKDMLAMDGMSVKDYMKLTQHITDELRTPIWKLTGKAKTRHSAYAKFARALDEFGESLPDSEALRNFGQGRKLYKVIADWQRARNIFEKGITAKGGMETYNPTPVVKEIKKLYREDPEMVTRIFGPKVARTMKLMGVAADTNAAAYRSAHKSLVGQVFDVATGMGIWRFFGRHMRAAKGDVFGVPMARPGMGR